MRREDQYLREPFNLKWFLMQTLWKWYVFVLGTILGAVLIGGSYFLVKVVFAPARDYQAETNYYLEYAHDPFESGAYTYFNEYTWNQWLHSDAFLETVNRYVEKPLSETELLAYVNGTILADVRMLNLRVVTSDPQLSMQITRAYLEMMPQFGEEQREFDSIRAVDIPEQAYLITMDVRTARAVVLGAVLGLFFTFMIQTLWFLEDDRIWLPEQLSSRFELPVLGCNDQPELAENLKFLCGQGKQIAVTCVGETPNLALACEKLGSLASDAEFVPVPGFIQVPESASKLRQMDGCILLVDWGDTSGSLISRFLSDMELQEVRISGAILWNVDKRVLDAYYFGRKRG